jgi:hypothetical protein
MKTHNYHPRLALLAITFILVACSKSGPDGTTAAAPATSRADVTAATGPITSGLYEVCRVAEDVTEHEDGLSREHLHLAQKVRVERIDAQTTTLVCIGSACPSDPMNPGPGLEDTVLWMTGDDTRLQTVQSFEHDDTSNGSKKRVLHLVQLTKEPSPPTGCDRQKNVLKLQFCKWGLPPTGPATWLCQGPIPHAGAAHIEN